MVVSQTGGSEIRHERTGLVFRPGLEGVPATQSSICDIDGLQGRLSYRGYSLDDLAVHSSFLETTYLLIWGELPTPQQFRDFEHEVQMHRRVSFRVRDMMKCFPANGHPMDALQSSAASLGLFYSRRAIDDPQYIYDAVVRLIAKIPTMVAAFQLIRKGQDPIQPRDDLAYSANFLYMLTEQEPDPLASRIFDRCLILHAEHSLNASTFSARVTASTLTDPYAVVASAVGTLAGPLHGGANQAVLEMLEAIKADGGDTKKYMAKAKDKSDAFRLMGFGHRVYKNFDPRAKIIKIAADEVLKDLGVEDPILDIAKALEKEALTDSYFVDRKLYPNVDFYSGIIYRAMGIPVEMFTVMFALGRLPGWIGQWKEMRFRNEPIGRPRQIYTGSTQRSFKSVSK